MVQKYVFLEWINMPTDVFIPIVTNNHQDQYPIRRLSKVDQCCYRAINCSYTMVFLTYSSAHCKEILSQNECTHFKSDMHVIASENWTWCSLKKNILLYDVTFLVQTIHTTCMMMIMMILECSASFYWNKVC